MRKKKTHDSVTWKASNWFLLKDLFSKLPCLCLNCVSSRLNTITLEEILMYQLQNDYAAKKYFILIEDTPTM